MEQNPKDRPLPALVAIFSMIAFLVLAAAFLKPDNTARSQVSARQDSHLQDGGGLGLPEGR
ncbi:MAG: hypothetical protein ACE5H3_10210 [Planctomycetota bacterium]